MLGVLPTRNSDRPKYGTEVEIKELNNGKKCRVVLSNQELINREENRKAQNTLLQKEKQLTKEHQSLTSLMDQRIFTKQKLETLEIGKSRRRT